MQTLASERRAKNREKLLAMKRYSGFLKRPEILETVYRWVISSSPASSSSSSFSSSSLSPFSYLLLLLLFLFLLLLFLLLLLLLLLASVEDPEDQGIGQEEEGKELQGEETIRRRESETTEYDYSTDDESLRMLMSETDQVAPHDTPMSTPPMFSPRGVLAWARGRAARAAR